MFLLGGMVLQFLFFRGTLVDPIREMVESSSRASWRIGLVLFFAGLPAAFGLTVARWIWLPKELWPSRRRHVITWLLTAMALAVGTAVNLVAIGDYEFISAPEAVASARAWNTGIAVSIAALYSGAVALSGYKWLAPIIQAVDYTRLRSLLQQLASALTQEGGSPVSTAEKRLRRLWLEEQEALLRGVREEAGKNLLYEDLPEYRSILGSLRSDAGRLAAFFLTIREENQLADLPIFLRGERGGFVTNEIQGIKERVIAVAQGCSARRGGQLIAKKAKRTNRG